MKHRALAGRLIAAHMGHNKLPRVNVLSTIKGIQSREKAIAFHVEAHQHNASKEVKEAIAEKLRELNNDKN